MPKAHRSETEGNSSSASSPAQGTPGNNEQASAEQPGEGSNNSQAAPGNQAGSDDSVIQLPQRPVSTNLDAEQRQALEQWLREIPDNPAELLRRKFWYEQQLHQENPTMSRFGVLLLTLLWAVLAQAEPLLQASVDRTRLEAGESLELTSRKPGRDPVRQARPARPGR